MNELNDLIGGSKGIVRIPGPFIGPEDMVPLDNNDLSQFRPDNNPENNVRALENLASQAHACIQIDDDTIGLLADKVRPYARLYDFMLIVADLHPENRFIQSINDMTAEQFTRVLSVSQDILSVYRDHSRKPMLTGISFNYQDNPLDKHPGASMSKTKAQTFPFAHAHIVGIETEDIPTELHAEGIIKSERRDVYDPTTLLIEQIISVPSINMELTEGLKYLKSPMEFLASGIRLNLSSNPADNVEVSQEIQLIHERFRKLYDRISSQFIDTDHADSVGMPQIQPDRHERIDAFMQALNQDQRNQTNSNQLYRLQQNLHRFADVIKPADNPDVLSGARPIAMRSFADTTTLYQLPGDTNWHLIIAPRIFSTGNMLASLGFMKEKPESLQPVNDEWRKDRQELVTAVKKTVQ